MKNLELHSERSRLAVAIVLTVMVNFIPARNSVECKIIPQRESTRHEFNIAKGQDIPTNPVVVGNRIYWIKNSRDRSSSGIMAASIDNTNAVQICPVQSYTNDLFSDNQALYWEENYHIMKYQLPNGPRSSVTEVKEVSGMTFDTDNLYWVNNVDSWRAVPILFTVPKIGGKSSMLVMGLQFEFTSERPKRIVASSDYLFWTDKAGGSVYRIRKNGGQRETIASNQNQPHAVAVIGKDLFWTCLGTLNTKIGRFNKNGTLMRASQEGVNIVTVLSGLDEPTALAFDEENVFIACRDRILKIPKTGGTSSLTVKGQRNIRGIQVDNSNIYWSDERGGIYRIKK